MAIVKRFKELLNLEEIDVLIDDVDKSKHIILTDMPESLPQGRSSFLIETSPFMRPGVEIQIDFVDSEGNSIYTEPVFDYLEGTSRRVSIEVYGDTAPGIATLIIVGELESVPEDNTIFSDASPVPSEYDGFYNVRLTKEVIINPTAVNTQPIKFFSQPTIRVVETQLGTMVRSEITGSITSSLFNVEGTPTDSDLLFKPYGAVEEEITQGILSETTTTSPSKQKGSKAFIETRKLKFRKGLRKNSAGKRSGFSAKRNSPVKFPYQLKIGEFDGDETFRFNTKHIGGTVQFFDSSLGNLFTNSQYYPTETLTDAGLNLETPTFDTSKVPNQTNISPTHYTASIVDLVNDRTAMIEFPFTNKNVNNENIILPIFGKGQILFESMPTGSYAPANLVSYANVQLNGMRTFSGDVFKIKVYVKSEGGFDDFKLLAEVPLEGRELLVDNASVGQGERTGYPIKQQDISDYWDVYGGTDALYEMTAADSDLSASYSNEKMLDSILISGSLNNNNHHIRFQLKDEYSFQLKPGIDYTLSGRIIGERKHNKTASLLMYVSGSSMKQKKFLYNYPNTGKDIDEPSIYGKRLGALEVTSDDDEKKDFGLMTHNFTPDVSGSGVLQLRVIHGEWNISDLSITPSDDTGFSPSFFEFNQELPAALSHKRPDKFEFLVEFYDVNNNISDTVIYEKDIIFQGTNMTITGNDNVLESSLFIGGDTIGGGMHLGGVTSTLPETGGAGAEGSGFMRSVGYEGFISASAQSGSYGFMIYSGSVLPDSGDAYAGVGLELVGASGSFKFRTNPSIFDVRADTFFIGRESLQYMSGSLGNIEISSSQFHLDPKNDALIIGADATILADLTANNIRTPAQINGVQSTDLNASSSISSQGLARFVSASIGGWTVGTGSIESVGGSLVLDPAGRQFRVSDGSNDRVHLGQVAAGEFGMKIFDGSGTADSNILVELGEGGNTIGGWTINTDELSGGEMVIQQNGTIKSAGFQQDVAGSGFILTAAQGGFLEVENAKIRGTMSTTTFEKESVNAVGGQLYVANSTTLTSSAFPTTLAPGGRTEGNYPANETTMSVANVSGFSVGEILTLKKVTDTGFSTEYVKVESSSFATPGSDTDLSGQLYLIRGYSGSQPDGQDSSSLGDTASSATTYSGSQVIVSTGKIGTGFVRINANPNDSATPYMDIVERTGSAIYDTELKVRLGDLSGVAGSRNVPEGFTGFGLMSEVAFLSGSNIKLEAPTFLLGDLNRNFVSGSEGNIEISSSKFHLDSQTEKLFVGQPNRTGSFIDFKGSDGTLAISASNFELTADGQITASSMNLTGISKVDDVSVADYFAFRFVEINLGNYGQYLETFTNGGKTYWRLKLDGSLGGEMASFVKLTALHLVTEYPIAQIIPPSQNNAGVTGVPPQLGPGSGHRIVLEVGSGWNMHLAKNITDSGTTYDSNGYLLNIASNNLVGFAMLRSFTISGTDYSNVMKVVTGTTVDLVKSEDSWLVQSISSLEDIGLQSPGGFALFNVDGDSSFAGAGGRPFAPFVFAGDATTYHNGTMFVTGNPTVRQDASLHLATSASLYTSASIALQSGTGNLFFMGVTHDEGRMSFGNKGNPSIDDGDDGDVGYALTTNGAQVWIKDNLYLLGDVSSSATPGERLKLVDSSANAIVRWDNQSTSTAAEFFRMDYTNTSGNLGASGHPIMVRVDNDIIYELRGDGSGGSTQGLTFTSGHDTSCKDDDDLMPGLIVRSTGVMWAHPTSSYETALPFTELCQTNGAKDVFGVIAGHLPEYHTSASLSEDNITGSLFLELSGSLVNSDREPYLKNGWTMKPSFTGYAKTYPTGSGNFHLHTNSIGEGSVWVTNINGEIENGDYIESSVIKGYGRKQDDDILRSKTVAKCLENIDWDNISDTIEYSGSAYKRHKAAVTFHCG